jgi:hypothetical protein
VLFDKYNYNDQVEGYEIGGACSTNWGEEENAYILLVVKPEGKRPPERPRRRWVDIFKMDLGEIG